jgi:hypothetical protein
MKVTNLSSSKIYLDDLRHLPEVRRGEDRYLAPGASVYLPNTSEVLRSAVEGDLHSWSLAGVIRLEDLETLAANGDPGDSVTLTHNFGFPPSVYVLKQVTTTWVDGTGTVDVVHNSGFTAVTITNSTADVLTFRIRLLS